MPAQGLARLERVRETKDYREIQRAGRRVYGSGFSLAWLGRDGGGLRLGLAVSRRVGNAVTRNRIKRYLREYFRLNKNWIREQLQPEAAAHDDWGMDLVVMARPEAAALEHREVDRGLEALIKKMAKRTRGGPPAEPRPAKPGEASDE